MHRMAKFAMVRELDNQIFYEPPERNCILIIILICITHFPALVNIELEPDGIFSGLFWVMRVLRCHTAMS